MRGSRRTRPAVALALAMCLAIPWEGAIAAAVDPTATAPAVAQNAVTTAWLAAPPAATPALTFESIAATGNSIYAVGITTGSLANAKSFGGSDLVLARYSTSGTLLWAKQIGTPSFDGPGWITADEESVYLGFHAGDRGYGETYWEERHVIVRLAIDGTEIWRRSELTSAARTLMSLAVAYDGGVVVAMDRRTVPRVGTAAIHRHYTKNGAIAWSQEVTGGVAGSLGADAGPVATDMSAMTVSGSRRVAPSGRESFVRRYGPGGTLSWERVLVAPYGDVTIKDVANAAANIWVAGVSQSSITDPVEPPGGDNAYIRNYSLSGTTLWTRPMRVSDLVAQCSSFVGIGAIAPPVETEFPGAFVERWAGDGTSRWRWELPGTTNNGPRFQSVAVASTVYLLESWTGSGVPYTGTRIRALAGIATPTDCDTAAPLVTAPTAVPTVGSSLVAGALPYTVRWSASDSGSGIARYELEQSTNGGAYASLGTAITKPSFARTLAPGAHYRFRVRAIDRAGNVSAWAYGTTFTVSAAQQTSASIAYTGTWSSTSSTSFWGGTAKYASTVGAKARITVTGRSFAWVASVGPTRGSANVYVNGVFVKSVSLYAASGASQRVVFATTWSTSAARTIEIRVMGTAGHPRVDIDGFAWGS